MSSTRVPANQGRAAYDLALARLQHDAFGTLVRGRSRGLPATVDAWNDLCVRVVHSAHELSTFDAKIVGPILAKLGGGPNAPSLAEARIDCLLAGVWGAGQFVASLDSGRQANDADKLCAALGLQTLITSASAAAATVEPRRWP